MNTNKIALFLFTSIILYSCASKIDGTSDKAYSESLKKIKSELSQTENDSLVKCITAILSKSEHTLLEFDKIREDFNGLTADDIFKKGAAILEETRASEAEAKRYLDSLTAVFVADSTAKYAETGNWSIKHFVDDFQQETKDGYITLSCNGSFTNSATTNSELTVQILVTDKEELQLFLNEYGSQPVKSFSSSGTPYNIKLLKNGKELTSYGNMYSDRITTSDKKIIGLLKEGGTIKVYLRENSDYGIGSSYLFEFDATNYDKAINKLKK